MKQKQYKCWKHLFYDLNFELTFIFYFSNYPLQFSIRCSQLLLDGAACFLKPRDSFDFQSF